MNERNRRPRRGKPGTLHDVKRQVWHAIMTASDLLDADDPLVRLKAVHAVGQASGVFKSVYETADLEARLEALERRVGGTDES